MRAFRASWQGGTRSASHCLGSRNGNASPNSGQSISERRNPANQCRNPKDESRRAVESTRAEVCQSHRRCSPPPMRKYDGIGVDIGKNSFHVVGQDKRGAIVLRQKWSRGQVEARLANMQPCLVGVESYVRRASSRSQTAGAWSRCSADAGKTCARFKMLCFLF